MIYSDSVLSPETIEIIRNNSPKAEAAGMLCSEQLDIIYLHKWFLLFVPKEYGGLALSLPEAVRLEENIAYADGSVGWVVTLCGGAGLFIGYFDEDLAKEVFAVPDVCLAGSGQANGLARIIEGGFEVNGSWPYASGAPHATHFTANCLIQETGQVQSFIFRSEEVTMHANWGYIGLNATAGYSYSVKDLRVPFNRTFKIDPDHARLTHPVYRYPFLQLAETTIAANISGMSLYFLELAKDILTKKQSSSVRFEQVKNTGLALIGSALTDMTFMRAEFYNALNTSWFSHVNDNVITPLELHAVSRASLHLAQQARNLVNQLYPYCGLDAARTDTPINQVWRNINTASQHTLLLAVH